MRRSVLPVLFALVLFAACQKDVIPEIPGEKPEPYVPAERVEGRVAVAYVTYWGTIIPDPHFSHTLTMPLPSSMFKTEFIRDSNCRAKRIVSGKL